jgi:hypothetical protein
MVCSLAANSELPTLRAADFLTTMIDFTCNFYALKVVGRDSAPFYQQNHKWSTLPASNRLPHQKRTLSHAHVIRAPLYQICVSAPTSGDRIF